jgi:hypothetical protein
MYLKVCIGKNHCLISGGGNRDSLFGQNVSASPSQRVKFLFFKIRIEHIVKRGVLMH